jgi:hypothetical protein
VGENWKYYTISSGGRNTEEIRGKLKEL